MSKRSLRGSRRAVERLEPRTLFAAVSFTGQGDGFSWTDPKNWSTGQLPQPADDVSIAGSIQRVTLASGAQSINSLNAMTPLSVTGGSLQIASGAQSNSTLTISGGDVVLNGPPSLITTLALSGGTLEGSGDVYLTGPGSTWTGGTMAGSGTTHIQQAASISVNSAGTLVSSRPFYNDGLLSLNGGSLEFTNLGLHSGTFSLADGTTLILGGSSEQTFFPLSTVTGAGGVDFTDSVSGFVDGTYHVGATALDATPTVRFSSAAAVTGTLSGNGGTLILGPPITTRPSRAFAPSSTGSLVVLTQHVFTSGILTVLPGWTLEDDGSGLLFAGTGSPTLQLYSDPVTPGQLLLGGDVSAAGTSLTPRILDFQVQGLPGRVNLNGSRSFTVGSGDLLSINANLDNGALRAAGPGTLQLLSANTYAGGTTVASGSGGQLEVHDPASLGTGTVTFAGGLLAARAGLAVTLANAVAAGATDAMTFDVSGGAVTLTGAVSLGSALNVGGTSGSLIVNGAVTLQHDATLDASMPVTINGAIGGAFGLSKTGPQILTIGGANPNTYSGTTEVVAGTVVANKSAGPAFGGDLRLDGPVTVSLNAAGQLSPTGALTFDSTGGTPALNLNNNSQAVGALNSFQPGAGSVLLGTATLSVGGGTYSGSLAGSGTLEKTGTGILTIGSLLQGVALDVGGGTVAVAPSNPAASNSVSSLTIAGGKLDLSNSTLLINYGANPSPIAAIRTYVSTGYDHGAWDGEGIVTTGGSLPLGYADAGGSIRIKSAAAGDANVDGKVDFSDLLILAQHYGQSGAGWDEGDFGYDGNVGFPDLLALAQHYGQTVTTNVTGRRR